MLAKSLFEPASRKTLRNAPATVASTVNYNFAFNGRFIHKKQTESR